MEGLAIYSMQAPIASIQRVGLFQGDTCLPDSTLSTVMAKFPLIFIYFIIDEVVCDDTVCGKASVEAQNFLSCMQICL